MAESTVQLQWAFSLKRQSAYATANPDVDITQSHPMIAADIGEHTPNMSDNAAMFGKGHEFATRNAILSWDSRFRRSFQANTKMAGWAWSFHCGKITTTTLGGSPTAYQHVIEYQDPTGVGYYGSGRQQPVTTIVEATHTGLLRRFPSMLVRAVEMTGALNDWVNMIVEMQGSGKMAMSPAFTMPASTEGALLRTGSLTFTDSEFGDMSCDVRSFRIRSEFQYFENEGYCPGSGYNTSGDPTSGQIRNKLEFSRRAIMLEFQIASSATSSQHIERLMDQDNVGAVLTLQGDLISGAYYHRFSVNIPSLQYSAIPIAADGDLIVYNVTALVFYDEGLDNPFEITIVNETSAYLVSS
jgi:hypothetical protein